MLKGLSVKYIYKYNSEVLSDLGRMFGMIFRVQWSQKSLKSGKMCLTKMYPGPARVLHRVLARVPPGPCKGAAGGL